MENKERRESLNTLQKIKSRMSIEQQYPIQHTYIDLKWLIIGEKLKAINDPEKLQNLNFDDLYFAEMILSQKEDL